VLTPPVSSRPPLTRALWTADHSVELVEHTIGELITVRAAQYPDREALVGVRHGSGSIARLTYAELLHEASLVAIGLSRLTPRGSYVALWAPNIVEWPIIQIGAALAGIVLVALNPVLRDDELSYGLEHSNASLLLHADVSRDYPMAEVAERVCAGLPGLRRVSLSERSRWMADSVSAEGITGAAPEPADVAMLQYTSGTTGRPKGVVLQHRSLVNVAKLTMEAVDVPDGSVCVNPLPMFHTAGCVIATLGPFWVAGCAVVVERFTPDSVLDQLRTEQARVLFYVPTVLSALVEAQQHSREIAPRLEVIMGGATTVPPSLIDRAAEVFGAGVFNLFGQTELAPVLSVTRPGDSRADRTTTVGRPLPRVDCKVTDPATGKVVAVGEVGEICARGYQQFVGYLHDPQTTAATLDADGFVRTGDVGTMDSRGFLTVTGRLKELIIRGGENIGPADIERVLCEHPAVDDAIAVGLPDERLGEIVGVVLCVGASEPDLKDSLISHARNRLAPFKIPARWFIADALPLTPTGKVKRFALREAIMQGEITEL
jgi:fatty-acyl-CoA synthase